MGINIVIFITSSSLITPNMEHIMGFNTLNTKLLRIDQLRFTIVSLIIHFVFI